VRDGNLVRSGLAVIAAVSLAGLASACSNQISGLVGNIGAGSSAGSPTTPGRPEDYTGFLANHTGQVVILKSAELLPVQGFRAPTLIHEAVETGRVFATSDRDWPPTDPQLPLRKFDGYRIKPGREVKILYSVAGQRLGEYADAGLRVTVVVNGSRDTVDVLSYAGTCIVSALGHDCSDSFYNRVEKAAERGA
jgi:hypothetical protein